MLRATNVQSTAALAVLLLAASSARAAPPEAGPETPVTADALDRHGFTEWAGGTGKPVPLPDGPGHVLYTKGTSPAWDGVRFGETRVPGMRHLRIGFKGR